MRFLLSTFGSAGDVFPLLGLALELQRQGHEATFLTNEHFRAVVERNGVAFEPLGGEEAFERILRHPDLWKPRRALPLLLRSLEPLVREQYARHVEAAASGVDAAVTNLFGFGALLARETVGLPVATVHLQPAVLWSDVVPPRLPIMAGPLWLKRLLYRVGVRLVIQPAAGRFLNPWRRELGLPPLRDVTRWWHSPTGVVGMFPEWFAPPQPDWPSPLELTDFPLWNDRTGADSADGNDDLEAFLDRGEPPVAFTPGSANVQARAFFEAAVGACARLGRRGILLTRHRAQVPTGLPASVVHVDYVPLDRLLPRCAAFVHHGGIGSASQALAAGIPQLVMPLAHDQFDNAERLRRLGVGDALGVSRFTADRAAARLAALLGSPQAAADCRAAAERLKPRDGLARSASAAVRMCGGK